MRLDAKMERLARMPPLAVLEAEAVRLLAFDGDEMAVEVGAVLFRQGEAADCGYAVIAGAVALERQAELPVPPRLLSAGALIGVNAMIAEVERPATATVREKALLVRLPRRLMLRVLDAFPDSALALRRYIADGLAGQAGALTHIVEAIDAVERSYRSRATRTGT